MGSYPMPGEDFFLYTLNSFNAFTFIVYIIKHVSVLLLIYKNSEI